MITLQNSSFDVHLLQFEKAAAKVQQQTNSVIDSIVNGHPKVVEDLYYRYRRSFGAWAAKYYGVDDDTAAEIYQRAFITFYYNIKDGKITHMSSSEKTYLFAIGKNLIREHFRLVAKQAEPLSVEAELGSVDHGIMEKYEQSHRKDTVRRLLAQIGEPCNSVLTMFYFHGMNMKEIAAKLNYKTEQIAAKRKFICLKQLRSLMGISGA